MSISIILIPALVALAAAVSFHMMPGGHPEFFFGVPVAAEFRQSADARSLLHRFYLLNWIVAALTAVLGCVGFFKQAPWLVVAAPILQLAAGMALFLFAKSQTEPFAMEPRSSIRRASLRNEPILAWWGWALMLLPVLIIAASAAWLTQHWDQIPARFPVHWNIDGMPDRWNEKSVKGVYGVLIIGLSTLALIYGVAAMTAVGAPRGGPAMSRLVRIAMNALAFSGAFAASLMSFIALQPLAADPQRMRSPLWIVVPVIAGSIGLIVTMARISSDAEAEAGGAPDDGWKMSSIYYSPRNPAMMVQRKLGFGFTPNFGHPVVKWAFPLLMLQMFAVIFYVTH